MKRLNQQWTLAMTGVFTVILCCFGLAGIPVFMVTAIFLPELWQAVTVTLVFIILGSVLFTLKFDKVINWFFVH